MTADKDDKRKLVKRKLLPGYVLVRMEMNDAAWSVVRETPGVTSFVGNEGKPTPVKIREVAKFLLPPETATPAAEKAMSAATPPGARSCGRPRSDSSAPTAGWGPPGAAGTPRPRPTTSGRSSRA